MLLLLLLQAASQARQRPPAVHNQAGVQGEEAVVSRYSNLPWPKGLVNSCARTQR